MIGLESCGGDRPIGMSFRGKGVNPFHTLLVCPDFKPTLGGEGELAFNLARQLQALGHEISVLVPPCSHRVPEDAMLSGAVIRQLDLESFPPLSRLVGWLRWPFAMFAMIRVLKRVIRETGSTVILVTSYHTWVTLAIRTTGLPFALFLHGEEVTRSARRGRIGKWFFHETSRAAAQLFFNSNYSMLQIEKFSPALLEKSESVGCGVDADITWRTDRREEARETLSVNGHPMLLTVARLILRKGIGTVIRAMPRILDRYPGARYVIVGEGQDRLQLEELVRETGVADHVVFTGRVDDDRRQQFYAASDIYIMVSHPGPLGDVEGFGLTFLEANLHGLPVIGSRCGGIPEAVGDGDNGLLVAPETPAEIVEAVANLVDHPDRCRRMAQRGQERIRSQYNWRLITERIADRLSSLQGDLR